MKWKKLLSLLVTAAMVLSLLPTSVLAVDKHSGWTELTAELNDQTLAKDGNYYLKENGNYYLAGDVTLTNKIGIKANVTICLCGHTISKKTKQAFVVYSGGNLTIYDCTGGGTVSAGNAIHMQSGTVTIDGVTIDGGTSSAIVESSDSTINVTNATLTGGDGSNPTIKMNGGELHISGGTIGDSNTNYSVELSNESKLYLSGDPTFVRKPNGVVSYAEIYLVGQGSSYAVENVIYAADDGKAYTGGKLDIMLPTMYTGLKDGVTIVQDVSVANYNKFALLGIAEGKGLNFDEGAGTLVYGTYVPYVPKHTHGVDGGTGDIQWTAWDGTEALTAGYYYLEGDVTITNGVAGFTTTDGIEIEGDVHLCLNGQTITGSGPSLFTVNTGGSLTICDCQDGGAITNTSTNTAGYVIKAEGGALTLYSGAVSSSKGRGIYVNDGSEVTIAGGSITANQYAGIYILNGSLDMSGGTLTYHCNNGIFSNNAGNTVSVTGGEILAGDGNVSVDKTGINMSNGTLTVSGSPTITGTKYGIDVGTATVAITGGTISADGTNGYGLNIDGTASVSLGGSPVITGKSNAADICLDRAANAPSAVANGQNYTGGPLKIRYSSNAAADGDVIVKDVTGANAEKFTLVYPENKYLVQSGDNLILSSTPPEPPTPDHSHGVDGSEGDQTWTEWTGGAAFSGDGYYYLTQDRKRLSSITISDNIYLCLNGHKLYTDGIEAFEIVSGGSLTICDCQGGGVIENTSTISSRAVIAVDGGTLTLNGGALKSEKTIGVELVSGTVNVAGGSITGGHVGGIYNRGGTVNITGGTITGVGSDKYGIRSSGNNAAVNLGGSPVITGGQAAIYLDTPGSLSAKVGTEAYAGESLSIYYRNNNAAAGDGDVIVKDVTADNEEKFTLAYPTGKYLVLSEGNLILSDTEEPPVTGHTHDVTGGSSGEAQTWTAWDGTTPLDTAGCYYLTDNVVLSSAVTVSKDVHLCLNGCTISRGSGNEVFSVTGKLTICDCKSGGTVSISNSYSSAAVRLTKFGSLTLYGGTLDGDIGNGVFANGGNTKVTIAGGTVSGTRSGGALGVSGGTVTITGGQVNGVKLQNRAKLYLTGTPDVDAIMMAKSDTADGYNNQIIAAVDGQGYTGELITITSEDETIPGNTIIVRNVKDDNANRFSLTGYELEKIEDNLVVKADREIKLSVDVPSDLTCGDKKTLAIEVNPADAELVFDFMGQTASDSLKVIKESDGTYSLYAGEAGNFTLIVTASRTGYIKKQVTVEFTVKKPNAPAEDTLKDLLNNRITVDCITAEDTVHPSATYGWMEGGCTLPLAGVTGSSTDGWKYVVTINADVYVDDYDTAKLKLPVGTHAQTESNYTITLTWDGQGWSCGEHVKIEAACSLYTLTYNANGGTFTAGTTFTVKGLEDTAAYQLGEETGYAAPTKGTDVFLGWTTDPTASGKVYGAGQQLPEVVTEVSIPETTIVYAVWGADTNDDSIADAKQIVITPADITVYTGGDGYDGVVDGAENHGIPEPGYYFTLPYALNEKLQQLTGSTGEYVNLANYIRLNDANNPERQWILTLYDGADTSLVTQGYIYRLTEDNSTPAKLVIKDSSGNIVTDDELAISNDALYQDYTMSLDDGAVKDIVVEIKDGNTWVNVNNHYNETLVAGLILGEGTLTVRGTDNSTPTLTTGIGSSQSDVVENNEIANEESRTTITAVAPEDTNYTINGSTVNTDGQIGLYTDGLLENNVLSEYLAKIDLTNENTKVDYQYLDLVDMSNGNAYVTADSALDIYWKLPADADVSGDISVVHFNGLDRNYDVADLADLIDANGVDIYSQEKNNLEIVPIEGELYLKFATSSFSPFALVYDTKDEPVVEKVTVTFKSGEHGDFGWYHVTSKDVELTKGGKLAAYQIPTVYEDAGYEFIGWYKQGSGSRYLYSNKELLEKNFYSDATFIAQYKYVGGPSVDDEYDVIYNANFTDGGYPRRMSYDDGDKVTVSENNWFEREGYTFIGWNTKANGNGVSYQPGDTFRMSDSDVYLYAQWQKNKPGPDDTGVSDWLNTKDHIAYMTGYPDKTFGPNRNMTRAEVAQMFYALLKNQNVTVTAAFSDVPANAWYAKAVNTMATLGMVTGYPDGTFHPDATITRAEFTTIALAFADGVKGAKCSYFDVPQMAWFYDYIAQATAYGWIGGSGGYFRPNDMITRAEVSIIVNNMLGRSADTKYVDKHVDELVTFPDVKPSYWAYYSIMETVNDHEYTGNYSNETWESVK